MTTPRLRVQPPDPSSPPPAALPLDRARRWLSPFEAPSSPAPAVTVFLAQKAYSEAVSHAASELDIEVGGVLVGEWHPLAEAGRLFIQAENALPARFTRQGNVFLTFTQDSLVDLHNAMDEQFPGKQIVGWYHTHPRMGVFLSHYDTWLHRYFFPEPWQVALVIEPYANLGGFFVRQADGSLDPSRYTGFYELDGNSDRSIVHWHNLQSELDVIKPEGDETNE